MVDMKIFVDVRHHLLPSRLSALSQFSFLPPSSCMTLWGCPVLSLNSNHLLESAIRTYVHSAIRNVKAH